MKLLLIFVVLFSLNNNVHATPQPANLIFSGSTFGGSYAEYWNGAYWLCLYSNPLTAACSCPSGYVAYISAVARTATPRTYTCQKNAGA